ncbi:MAG TPA: cysteine dioxygenase family protein [Candidatus Binatia bacterium]|nr:cysteine dioxygenase family protein [Candidatus Binatia bacterium]
MATAFKDTARVVPVGDFVSGLRRLRERDFTAIEGTLEYLRANRVDAASLQPYLFWNSQHYTRNLIDKTELYELLAICWEVGMKSSIHNHKGQNCWMAAPIGRLAVQNYRVLSEDLDGQRCQIVPTDEVHITADNPVAVDPLNPVHDVRNPREWNQRAVSLHVYSRPFNSCIVYSVEQGTCGEIGLQYTSMHGKLCGASN